MSVSNGQLVNGSKLELPHAAVGIAHHQGALYITSGTALYQYTLTGKLVKMLYESKAGDSTVYKCAVSPAGDKIYVTNLAKHQLLTLTTDGTLLSTFKDAELQTPNGVHVTPAGQILVCAYSSNSVIQVDGEGKKKLATVALQKDGSSGSMSICYNAITERTLWKRKTISVLWICISSSIGKKNNNI
ncbi:uncharacterized protein LOC127857570 [Dreissena polymorpha]|uniref:uncharacterized protein LOC127857570 n=1 Tax=Dreissena polymorpha TaxID=45954 RepID=UPI002264605D|nr:uncharacterized protein LOC127857570 [Dreissena polymorpha]